MLLVKSGTAASIGVWQDCFARVAPTLPVSWWSDTSVDPSSVKYVLVWQPEPGFLATLPNLKSIFSTGAGVDHITADLKRPMHVPIVRMASAELAQTVGEYVCMMALMALREQPRLADLQARRSWDYFEPVRTAFATRVGIMGLGNIGLHAARMLRGLGFDVCGWARTAKPDAEFPCYSGAAQLPAFLSACHILVGLLPHTADTAGLLDKAAIETLPPGAAIINVGRGSLLDPCQLISAIDSGHIAFAALDVFDVEPLPADHPAWAHPKIVVTPHIAGYASRQAKARHVAEQIARFERGESPQATYAAETGY